jgi:sulfite dehydrogenase (cytochrome) subunit A
MDRRSFIGGTLAASGMVAFPRPAGADSPSVTLPFENGVRRLAAYPEKRAMIVMTTRPVQLETPFELFDRDLYTPNDAFFVRWHLAGMPTSVDAASFRLTVSGAVATPLRLSLADLRHRFEAVELAAVCECAGNSRGFSEPRVPGGQWGNGAMGNARWKGVRLRDILNAAALDASAVQVRLRGLDSAVFPQTPQFEKALDLSVATSPDVVVAYEMNGAELPLLNGYPLRLVVPGWFATYWVKMLSDIEVLAKPDDGYWMKTAYRVPATPDWSVVPGTTGFATEPIGQLTIRSFITNYSDGQTVAAGRNYVRGIAFDRGEAITSIEFSSDGGRTWGPVHREHDGGRYGFERWSSFFDAEPGAAYQLSCRAQNAAGDRQITRWNPAGYARNAPEVVAVKAGS